MKTRLITVSWLTSICLWGFTPLWSNENEPISVARFQLVNRQAMAVRKVQLETSSVEITADDGTRSRWPWNEIARIDFRSEPTAASALLPFPQHEIWLTNGDRIAAFVKEIQDEKLQIGWVEQTNWQAEPIPLELVEVAVLKAPTSLFGRADFRRRIRTLQATTARKNDVALLSNGDELPGELMELGAEMAEFARQKETLQVSRFRMAAIVLSEELLVTPQPAKSRWRVVTNDGSAFTVRELRPVGAGGEPAGRIEFLLMTGTRLVIPLQDVVSIEFASDSHQWLDDLPLESHVWRPWLPSMVQDSTKSMVNHVTRRTNMNRLTGIHETLDETAFWALIMSPEEELTWRLPKGQYQLSGRVRVSGATTLSAAAEVGIDQNGKTVWASHELNWANNSRTFQLELVVATEEKLTFKAKSGPAGDQGIQLIWSDVSLRVK